MVFGIIIPFVTFDIIEADYFKIFLSFDAPAQEAL